MWLNLILLLNTIIVHANDYNNHGYCDANSKNECIKDGDNKKYLFYDINPPEGFNLRRDVYMRFAIMLSNAHKKGLKNNWNLVLPPWYNLYHWSSDTERFHKTPTYWRHFFDLNALKRYESVLELDELFSDIKGKTDSLKLDRIYFLQNYENMFENGEFKEKWEISEDTDCYYDTFWGFNNVSANEIICIKFQGRISQLWEIISLHPNDKKVMFIHGEIPLHDNYGNKEYWDCRKSMKFNTELVNTALEYIKNNFNGEKYVSVHWRRQDFARSRYKESPSIKSSAKQINKTMKTYNSKLTKIFIATDAITREINELTSELEKNNYEVFYYNPNNTELHKFRDGGIAIIDQIICSHSEFFIGTHESTFTFRIQEEREIFGFPSYTTFNRLCPDSGHCERPSKWTIVN